MTKRLILLLVLTPACGCQTKPAPASGSAKSTTPGRKAVQSAKRLSATGARKIPPGVIKLAAARNRAAKLPPLKFGRLKVESSAEVAKKLIKANYDPTLFGLKQLEFKVTFTSRKSKTKAEARGVWRGSGAPEVKLLRSWHEGKEITGKERLGKQVHTALTFRLRRLLNGIGRSFLSQRLAHWKATEGKVAQPAKDRLQLTFKEETGTTTVVVGPGYHVQQVTNRSPKGVTRTMAYEHKVVKGRALVKRARLTVQFDKNARLPSKARKVIAGAHDTVFEMSYVEVGGYHLPARLHKKMPGIKDEITLVLKYSAAR